MTTYAQTTIHSRVSKFEKTNGDGTMGRLVKGSLSGAHDRTDLIVKNTGILSEAISPQKDHISIPAHTKKKLMENNSSQNMIMSRHSSLKKPSNESFNHESSIFPSIYFKKTTMRNVLKQFSFPGKCKALPPNDERTPLAYQIVANLFNEIIFYVFNLLVAQCPITQKYYVFFSDSETIPFAKCCQSPVFVEMHINGTGKILCNGPQCSHPNLAQFLINFEDGKKLWKDITFLSAAPQEDAKLKEKITNCIKIGKYKNLKLNNLINQTSKEVSNIFFQSQIENKTFSNQRRKSENPFLTDNAQPQNETEIENQDYAEDFYNQEEKIEPNQKNLDLIKMKLAYMTKRQKGMRKKLAKGIVDESKVFHQKFDIIQKIDEYMAPTTEAHHSGHSTMYNTRFNFPKIMRQIKNGEQRRAKSMARTQGLFSNKF